MIQMPGLAETLIYIPDIWLSLCLPVSPSCHYFNWGNLNTRYISDHEKLGGWWDQAGILSIMSRTEPLCYSWVFYPRNSRSNSRIPRQHHFICLWNSGQTSGGAKYIVGRLYLLFTIYYICLATKISSELTQFDNLTSVINNFLPTWPPADSSQPGSFPTHGVASI